MIAGILNIGDELLMGQVLNTNAQWMGSQLQEWGFQVGEIRCIPDQQASIEQALQEFSEKCQLVLVTGGLGPTKDDVTKKAVCSFFNCGLRRDPDVLVHVQSIFSRFKKNMPVENQMQADIPEIAEVLFNEMGTAPGIWIESNGCYFVFMAGVPREMRYIMLERVAPRLSKIQVQTHPFHQNFLVAGIGESYLAEEIADLENALPTYISLAYLPSLGYIRLRLSAFINHHNKDTVSKEMDEFINQVEQRIGHHFIGKGEITLASAILERLQIQKQKLATAESCTGGLIAHLLTQIPGSSAAYEGGAVTYSNALKMSVLGVKAQTLESYGAVSEETVREMAVGAIHRFKVDIAVSVSGIAGPTGATELKPVGTVWIAVATKDHCFTRCYGFASDRETNIERSAQAALFEIWKLIHN